VNMTKPPTALPKEFPLHTLPFGGKGTSALPSAAEGAFAGHHAEVVDAASVYGELSLELRALALGLSSPGVATERGGDQAEQVAA
jgi:hypothetical protein